MSEEMKEFRSILDRRGRVTVPPEIRLLLKPDQVKHLIWVVQDNGDVVVMPGKHEQEPKVEFNSPGVDVFEGS